MDGGIVINFCTEDKPLLLNDECSYVVENLCIQSAQYLGIGPVARHLFGLWHPSEKLWLAPCQTLTVTRDKKWILHFRIRFKTPTVGRLKDQTDPQTFNYYFHQVRNDFFAGKIPELLHRNLRSSALGLVAADIIRYMLEQKQSPDTMKYSSRDFVPQELKRSPIWDNFLKDPLQKAVNKGWVNSKQNPDFVKEMYLHELYKLVPEYGAEAFSALVDDCGKVYEVTLSVDPYHANQPGLRMRVQKSKGGWSHICSIEDLCYISMRQDETVELSRQNGVPQYLQFHKTNQMHSFVSLLDGYYRLTEKWTFNLCKDLTTPSLLNLRSIKCHGPVDPQFAYKKLREKADGEIGMYLLRECAYIYNEYCLDILLSSELSEEKEPQTIKIYQDEDGNYVLQGYDKGFPSFAQLLFHHTKNNGLKLKRCIPPSEYDKSNLLLCRPVQLENRALATRSDYNSVAQCIPHDALIYFEESEHEFSGHLTIVRHALLKRSGAEFHDVVIKSLQKETKVTHLQEFLAQCDRTLFLQHDALVSTMGMILTQPTGLVMEHLPMGRLDHYLQQYENRLKQVDLVEAAYHVARALWYLEEQQWCHGKIRCHNILVASHVDNSFKVKLADPGLISYTDADIHWIPPECFADYSLSSKSFPADVYAYGTTLWQIFSYGCQPLQNLSPKEAKEWYQKGNVLDFGHSCHKDIHKLILECWTCDPDNRKRPQAIVRDLNQVLYEVYNSRRSHSYAIIGPGTTPVLQETSPSPKPPTLPANRPTKDLAINSIFKNVIKWQLPVNNGNFPYNPLSQSTNNGSSGQSTCTILTELGRESPIVPVNSLGSICEGDSDHTPDMPMNVQGDLSWVIDKEQLTIKGTLGQGFYGEVLRATLTHCSGLTSEEVAVKRIRMSDQSAECFTDLKREIEIMKNLRHKNIVEIKGLVEDPETMLVMEYLELGSLLAYLQLHKNKLSCSHLLKFAADVAEGMEYLEKKHIVHRDLAARNILVSCENHVKISDFGLAQFTEDHYYRMRTDRNLPIRWYALESITKGKFSHKSDVWSYGITLWEMFSYGENPEIPGVPDTALNEALQQGQRLGITENCPSLVYTLMRACWEKDSHERPTFTEILQKLTQLQAELCS